MNNPKYVGVLCCGGKGERLGEISQYITKPFIPVFDRPVFKYAIEKLERSSHIDEIYIIANENNADALNKSQHKVIIQDDSTVFDMFSALTYLKKTLTLSSNVVLLPCDNYSNVSIDKSIKLFESTPCDIAINLFSCHKVKTKQKLGIFNLKTMSYRYDQLNKSDQNILIAPYIVSKKINLKDKTESELLNTMHIAHRQHQGYWFDIGTPYSLYQASQFRKCELERINPIKKSNTNIILK
ncbi:sugar phosphate nucleotidyltransferase [uncultured Shewanella sp.]|uniref:sugar phosphate nucleotidyltransferase n=1 Tax=uncultured Shewanella sp. TaxID=173975 RepID=UPI00263120CC|nr:sugar phosphate nucleotidyltransferase [uncultured Shewanella sp.]